MAINKDDIVGKKFGKLTVISYSHWDKEIHYYNCDCDCGGHKVANRSSLKGGQLNSCGCMMNQPVYPPSTIEPKVNIKSLIPDEIFDKHKWNKIKGIYSNMKSRCENENSNGYKNYGGRGIKICSEWRSENGILKFYEWSINNGYSLDLSIDRIDVNGNYEPSNCRWATREEQANNTRASIRVEYEGNILTLYELSNLTGVRYGTLNNRYSLGLRGDDLINKKPKSNKIDNTRIGKLEQEVLRLSNIISILEEKYIN